MGGERLEVASMGWHGLDGDRRMALRRVNDTSGFPWLSASKLPELVLFAPRRHEDGAEANLHLPIHIRTPDGKELPAFGEELAAEIERRYGAPVQMMQLKHGIFDEANISVIASDTVREIGRLAGRSLDVRRFRPNVVVRLLRPVPFQEDEWVGGVLSFGDGDDAPAITVTMRDKRCSMVNLDPDSASPAPEVMKAIVSHEREPCGNLWRGHSRWSTDGGADDISARREHIVVREFTRVFRLHPTHHHQWPPATASLQTIDYVQIREDAPDGIGVGFAVGAEADAAASMHNRRGRLCSGTQILPLAAGVSVNLR